MTDHDQRFYQISLVCFLLKEFGKKKNSPEIIEIIKITKRPHNIPDARHPVVFDDMWSKKTFFT